MDGRLSLSLSFSTWWSRTLPLDNDWVPLPGELGCSPFIVSGQCLLLSLSQVPVYCHFMIGASGHSLRPLFTLS